MSSDKMKKRRNVNLAIGLSVGAVLLVAAVVVIVVFSTRGDGAREAVTDENWSLSGNIQPVDNAIDPGTQPYQWQALSVRGAQIPPTDLILPSGPTDLLSQQLSFGNCFSLGGHIDPATTPQRTEREGFNVWDPRAQKCYVGVNTRNFLYEEPSSSPFRDINFIDKYNDANTGEFLPDLYCQDQYQRQLGLKPQGDFNEFAEKGFFGNDGDENQPAADGNPDKYTFVPLVDDVKQAILDDKRTWESLPNGINLDDFPPAVIGLCTPGISRLGPYRTSRREINLGRRMVYKRV